MTNTSCIVTSNQTNTVISKTPSHVLGGTERRAALKVWNSLGQSMARVNLLKTLIKEGMGLAELEEFNLGVSSKYQGRVGAGVLIFHYIMKLVPDNRASKT